MECAKYNAWPGTTPHASCSIYKANQIVGEIPRLVKLTCPDFSMLLDGLSICEEILAGSTNIAVEIPGLPAPPHGVRGPRSPQILNISSQKRVEFDQMSVLRLRVNLPDKRSLCPLGPDEGILSAHKIHITGPQ